MVPMLAFCFVSNMSCVRTASCVSVHEQQLPISIDHNPFFFGYALLVHKVKMLDFNSPLQCVPLLYFLFLT